MDAAGRSHLCGPPLHTDACPGVGECAHQQLRHVTHAIQRATQAITNPHVNCASFSDQLPTRQEEAAHPVVSLVQAPRKLHLCAAWLSSFASPLVPPVVAARVRASNTSCWSRPQHAAHARQKNRGTCMHRDAAVDRRHMRMRHTFPPHALHAARTAAFLPGRPCACGDGAARGSTAARGRGGVVSLPAFLPRPLAVDEPLGRSSWCSDAWSLGPCCPSGVSATSS